MTDFLAGVLTLMYCSAAIVRYRAASVIAELSTMYYISVVFAVAHAGMFLWLLIGGENDVRLTISRGLTIMTLTVVWIWPPLVAIHVRHDELEELRKLKERA